MPSEVIQDFDPIEWKEFLPGVYHLRSDPTKIAFLCKEERKEEIKREEKKEENKNKDKN